VGCDNDGANGRGGAASQEVLVHGVALVTPVVEDQGLARAGQKTPESVRRIEVRISGAAQRPQLGEAL
jgi:hypothetical protein